MDEFLKRIFGSQAAIEQFHKYFLSYALHILAAFIIFIIGLFVSKILRRTLHYFLKRYHVEATICEFICRLFYGLCLILVVIATLSKLGVQTASLVAVIGAASLAVGLSLKNYLSNFASGILLISSRLFKIGEVVEIDGKQGTVEDIQIFFTTIRTFDNQTISVPNSSVVSSKIIHYSKNPTRRINVTMGISYDDDIDKARNVLLEIMQANERIQKEPAPVVFVSELADSSVNLLARCWVNRGDFWLTKCDLNERFKKAFDANDITIPFPQRDVHMITSG